jgi:hypothetical protein
MCAALFKSSASRDGGIKALRPAVVGAFATGVGGEFWDLSGAVIESQKSATMYYIVKTNYSRTKNHA